jgi:protein-tyrosine-phosphatase
VDASYEDHLVYPGIEKYGEMAAHPTVVEDVKALTARVLAPFQGRKKILFTGPANACRSQMAWAFAMASAGHRLEIYTGGSHPADEVDPAMLFAMAEKGIDMAFHSPRAVEDALLEGTPDLIIDTGGTGACPEVPEARRVEWNLPDPSGGDMEKIRSIRDEIEKRVAELIGTL